MSSIYSNQSSKQSNNCETYKSLLENGAILLDVRTIHEFTGAHVPNSVNIPLGNLRLFIEEIKAWNRPVVICSVYGQRSQIAKEILRAKGIEAHNGGCWEDYYEC